MQRPPRWRCTLQPQALQPEGVQLLQRPISSQRLADSSGEACESWAPVTHRTNVSRGGRCFKRNVLPDKSSRALDLGVLRPLVLLGLFLGFETSRLRGIPSHFDSWPPDGVSLESCCAIRTAHS